MDKVDEYYLANMERMDKELEKFNNEQNEFFTADVKIMSSVIRCHLILENYIDRYLEKSYPTIENWDSIRLTFNQKVEMINYSQSAIKLWYAGIKELNSLRNKYAHNIHYPIKEQDYAKMEERLNDWYNSSGQPRKTGIGIIPKFTQLVCAYLDITVNGIENHGGSYGLPAYLKWWRENFVKGS